MHYFNLLLTSILLLLITWLHAQKSPLEVVQAQLDYYNAQDVKQFASVFHEDALVYRNLGDAEPSMKGRTEIENVYSEMFQKYPSNKSILQGRMIQGNFVFDHELIIGRERETKIMAIYEVIDEKIKRCWFVR
jgi:hypothetical protein